MLFISRLQISECPLSKHPDHLSAAILIFRKRNSWGGLNLANMKGDSIVPLLFGPKTVGRLLQCADAHYYGEERTSILSTFLASHGQYAYTNSPKLECKTWYLLFDFQVHIRDKLHLKTKSAQSLPLIFEMETFRRAACSDNTMALSFQIICKT